TTALVGPSFSALLWPKGDEAGVGSMPVDNLRPGPRLALGVEDAHEHGARLRVLSGGMQVAPGAHEKKQQNCVLCASIHPTASYVYVPLPYQCCGAAKTPDLVTCARSCDSYTNQPPGRH
ncbi:MAG TPA: hypothetical protein PKE00_17515, partial [Planctomycetota bacterium]|nr:hypothetical protein [Planctomycetota bacterium]